MKNFSVLPLILLVMLLFVLNGCGAHVINAQNEPAMDVTTAIEPTEEIIIGGLAALSGSESFYGVMAEYGTRLAIEEVNASGGLLGKQVRFVSYDTLGDAKEAVNAYNRLKNENHAIAVIGDSLSTSSIAVAQRAVIDRIPMIAAVATSEEITQQGDNIFTACFVNPFQGKIMAQFAANQLNATRVALLYDVANNYSKGQVTAFIAEAEAAGMDISAHETYNKGDRNFTTQLLKIAETNPDLIYMPNYYNDNMLIVRQARQIGLNMPFIGGDAWDGILEPEVIGPSRNDADNTYFSNHFSAQDPSEQVQSFLEKYKTRYGKEAVSFAALGYDAAQLMIQAIRDAGSTDCEAVTAAMKALDYEGVTGRIRFDAQNNPIKPVSIIKITDGAYQLFTRLEVE